MESKPTSEIDQKRVWMEPYTTTFAAVEFVCIRIHCLCRRLREELDCKIIYLHVLGENPYYLPFTVTQGTLIIEFRRSTQNLSNNMGKGINARKTN